MNIVLFTAHVTNDVPPKLVVASGPDSPLQKDGVVCNYLAVKAERQITVHLGNKTLINEAAGNLASAHDCGKRIALHQVGQNNYAYVDDNEEAAVGNLSHVTLQIRNANLVAKFEQMGAAGPAPVVPMMPGSQVPAPVGQGVVNAPAAVTPVAVVAPQPSVTPLRGDLPQESFSNKRLSGIAYKDYQWYVKNPNRPSSGKDQADYDLLYPIFVKEEGLYATLQEELKEAADLARLKGCLTQSDFNSNASLRGNVSAYQDYLLYVQHPRPDSARGQASYDHDYPILLQKEKEHLAQQATNKYHSAS